MRRPVNAPYTITTEFGVRDSYALFGHFRRCINNPRSEGIKGVT